MTQAQHCSRWRWFVPPTVRSLSSLPVRLPAPDTPLRSTWLMDFLLHFPVHCPNPADKIVLLVPPSCLSLFPRLRLSSRKEINSQHFGPVCHQRVGFELCFHIFIPLLDRSPHLLASHSSLHLLSKCTTAAATTVCFASLSSGFLKRSMLAVDGRGKRDLSWIFS